MKTKTLDGLNASTLRPRPRYQSLTALFFSFLGVVCLCASALGSDHADTTRLVDLGREDAMIGDFYAFTRSDRLVLAMTIVAKLPLDPESFEFPDDIAYRFFVDRNPKVVQDGSDQAKRLGGLATDPAGILEDVVIEIRFHGRSTGTSVNASGLRSSGDRSIRVFAGVRDDPFIRATVTGKNVAAIVVELPLNAVIAPPDHSTFFVWSTTDVLNVDGVQDELGAAPYRSQLPPEEGLNVLHPSKHTSTLKLPPDVLIFDTARPTRFPNGRDLVDDVVDILGRRDDAPFPSENDKPFLAEFPYLAPPHLPTSQDQ